MSEYLKTIVITALVVGMVSTLLPKDSFGKYVNLLAGIIVIAVVISPILDMQNKDIDFSRIDVYELELSTSSYIMEEYEKELAKKISDFIKEKKNTELSVLVRADKKDNIIEIKEIEIAPYNADYAFLISDYLGIDEGRITQK